jgi:predicted transcriptional regulator YdeE
MQTYSHGAFEVTGIKIRTTNKNKQDVKDIKQLLEKFISEKIGDNIQHKMYLGIHIVYYNYANTENPRECDYDTLIGYITEDDSVQDDTNLNTIQIPAQDYQYIEFTDQNEYYKQWEKVNSMSKEECNRAFGYDLDMYNEDMSKVTLTVSVHK